MAWYQWTPCHVDPFRFVCEDCPVGADTPCLLRNDESIRHEEAQRWRQLVKLQVGLGSGALESRAEGVLLAVGISTPVPLLADYVHTATGETVDPATLEAILRASVGFIETSPGMFAIGTSDVRRAPLQTEDVSSGAMLAKMLNDHAPLPEGEQVALFKKVAALRRLSSFVSREAAILGLQAEVDRLLADVCRVEEWQLGDVAGYALGTSRPPILPADAEERLAGRSDLLTAVAALEILGGTEPSERAGELKEIESTLILHNMRLVSTIARRYAHGAFLQWDDLVQHGVTGLIRAVQRFNAYQGTRFSTYATWWVRQSITRASADEERIIRIPVHVVETISRYDAERRRLGREGRHGTLKSLAGALGMHVSQLRTLLARRRSVLELRPNVHDQLVPFDDDAMDAKLLQETIQSVVESLDPREAQIIQLRFGLLDGESQTLEAIGRQYHVTRERIRQIEAKALRKLKGRKGQPLRAAIAVPAVSRDSERRRWVPSEWLAPRLAADDTELQDASVDSEIGEPSEEREAESG